jgi:tRNA pseudouridine55 synthase
MDGLLIVDKPAGPTSHDVVARVRRVLRERRVGHTGTLDPMATGVLPLVVGRATRLARFLSAGDKAYEAVIVFGYATDTGDSAGRPIAAARPAPPEPSRRPSREDIERALDGFRGTFLQQPPVYSAKKIGGKRSYAMARAGSGAVPAGELRPRATEVTVRRLDLVGLEGSQATVSLECSAGFYVRSLAHDLGEHLGNGAHLAELRRTRSGEYALHDAIALDTAERDPGAAVSRLLPLSQMLQRLPAIALTADGVHRARHGQDLHAEAPGPGSPYVRLTDADGELIGIAEPSATSGLLHPFVVLG